MQGLFVTNLKGGKMSREIDDILIKFNIQPVLIDIGASGAPPEQWKPIARRSAYVGFNPDQGELQGFLQGEYARSIIINEAVTSVAGQNEANFYRTRLPCCSSTLPPDTEALSQYIFSDLLAVEKEVSVRASSLNATIDRLGLQGVDWFKADSQGTELRLFQSLRDDLRNRVLAVDIELGLVDAYKGEDLFVDAHRELLRQGFWPSLIDIKSSVRMKRATLQSVKSRYPRLQDVGIYEAIRPCPGWCEARYLRTIESLNKQNSDTRDYVLLWVFAMIERQWGYALDVAHAYEQRYGNDATSMQLLDLPMKRILAFNPGNSLRSIAKLILPKTLRERIKNRLHWWIA